MKIDILVNGGNVWIPGSVQASFSTIALLEFENKKVLLEPGYLPSIMFLEEEMKKRRLKPEDITDLIISHVHLDHGYNSLFFKKSLIHVHENYSKKDYKKFGIIMGQAYDQMVKSWEGRVKTFKDGDLILGKIKVLYTPYHSKDHVSFIFDTENMGKVFFPGDICMNRIELYDIIRGLRTDKVAEIIKENISNVDWILFTHDKPYKVR